MKKENILFLAVVVSSILPQMFVIWSVLSLRKWASGVRLLLESGIVWIAWIISTVLTFIFFTVTEQTIYDSSTKSFLVLHSLRLLVLAFVYIGGLAGVLYLLQYRHKTKVIAPKVWQTSLILSISTLIISYGLVFVSFYILTNFFGEF